MESESEVESFLIMVGVLPILERPVMAFVRLETVQFIGMFIISIHIAKLAFVNFKTL